MKNLKIFDLKNNPLECNDDFRTLMKFLGTRKVLKTYFKSITKPNIQSIVDYFGQPSKSCRIRRNEVHIH